ncbi:Aldo/keto reductase [Pseudomonas savastanoi pv. glycinea]|uniref:aldo/keto reductase n=1 Tax=Pseudomonas quasicaspiana TaxID=2829821 RepID=UPI000EFE165F|nr:aldo/keto reductase [Pseudomonas quasicaspiana]MCD5975161.1 aldo/keto reductase [Pseudomonas quasicaspiana]RMR08698.1 Aldo/keto reductase [Pseudomonas savastanoi pv. glycinea]
MRTLELAGKQVPVIGQGTWHMGERQDMRSAEIRALCQGIELGLNLIDTAEMYADGIAEQIVGEAIAGQRDRVFVVSKVYPHNASRSGIPAACERSLKRMKTDYIDLYLLHWPGSYPLEETVEAFERLREEGKIGRWGVSNFDVPDLLELNNPACATNQVLYNPEDRAIEFDLLPWAEANNLPTMAYCPIGQGQAGNLLHHPALHEIAARHNATPAQISLAWVLRQSNMIAIPKAVTPNHIELNAAAAELVLTAQDLADIDRAWPVPSRKMPLAMV